MEETKWRIVYVCPFCGATVDDSVFDDLESNYVRTNGEDGPEDVGDTKMCPVCKNKPFDPRED